MVAQPYAGHAEPTGPAVPTVALPLPRSPAGTADPAGTQTEDLGAGAQALRHPVYDPYDKALLMRPLRGRSPLAVLAASSVIVTAGIAMTTLDGGFGGLGDVTAFTDLRRILGGREDLGTGPASFPFLRDFVAWIIIVIMLAEVTTMQRQWRLFGTVFTDLIESGALKPSTVPLAELSKQRWFRRAGLANVDRREWLAAFLASGTSRGMVNLAILASLVISLLAGYLVTLSQNRGLFRLIAENGGVGDVAAWIDLTHRNWWGGAQHPYGMVAGVLLGGLAAYVVVVQTLGGMKMVAAVRRLPSLTQVDADWLNRDGISGWRSAHRVFLTVYQTQILYAVLVTVLLVTLDIGGLTVLFGAIWLAFSAAYIIYPAVAFAALERRAKSRRIAWLVAHAQSTRDASGLAATDPASSGYAGLVAEIERIRTLPMNPMKVRPLLRAGALGSMLLPLSAGPLPDMLSSVRN